MGSFAVSITVTFSFHDVQPGQIVPKKNQNVNKNSVNKCLEIISNNATGSAKFRQAEKLLKCPTNDRNYDRFSALSLEQDPHQFDLRRCRFPGWQIFLIFTCNAVECWA